MPDNRHTLTTFDPYVSKDADVGQRHVCYFGNYKHDHKHNKYKHMNLWNNEKQKQTWMWDSANLTRVRSSRVCHMWAKQNTVWHCVTSAYSSTLKAQNNFRESFWLTCSCWSSPAHRCQGRTPLLLLLLGLCLWISSVSAWTAAAAVSSFLSGNWVKSPRVESGCLPGWESRGSRVAPPGCPRGWSLHPLHLWGTPTSSAPSSPSPVIWGWIVSGLWACWTYSWCPPCEQEHSCSLQEHSGTDSPGEPAERVTASPRTCPHRVRAIR